MITPPLSLVAPRTGAVTRFAERLVAHDLPALEPARRSAAVAFAARRVAGLPSPMALGVQLVAATVDVISHVGGERGATAIVGFIARRPLPVVGEYARLVRSLVTAYVWETWPDTAADGAAG